MRHWLAVTIAVLATGGLVPGPLGAQDLGASLPPAEAQRALQSEVWQPLARVHRYVHRGTDTDVVFLRRILPDDSEIFAVSTDPDFDHVIRQPGWIDSRACPAIIPAVAYIRAFAAEDMDPLPGIAMSNAGGYRIAFPHGPGAELSYNQGLEYDSTLAQFVTGTLAALRACGMSLS